MHAYQLYDWDKHRTTEQKLCVIWRGEQDLPHTREGLLQEPFGSSKHKFGALRNLHQALENYSNLEEDARDGISCIRRYSQNLPTTSIRKPFLPKVAPVAQIGVVVLIVGACMVMKTDYRIGSEN
ncbi:hypothetical protein Bca101_058460 [Brassica carinata]